MKQVPSAGVLCGLVSRQRAGERWKMLRHETVAVRRTHVLN
jgi:hypothetical protein